MRFFTTPLLLALVLGLFSSAWALQANLAGVVDWHTQQVGQPILGASPPAFVDTSSGKRLLLTITHSNVFAALDGPNIGELRIEGGALTLQSGAILWLTMTWC